MSPWIKVMATWFTVYFMVIGLLLIDNTWIDRHFDRIIGGLIIGSAITALIFLWI